MLHFTQVFHTCIVHYQLKKQYPVYHNDLVTSIHPYMHMYISMYFACLVLAKETYYSTMLVSPETEIIT